MKLSDKIFFIKKEKRKVQAKKCTIIILLALIFTTIASFAKSVDYYIYDTTMQSYDYNYRFVTRNSLEPSNKSAKEKLKKIEHIREVFEIYEKETIVDIVSIDNNSYTGTLRLRGMNKDELKKTYHNYKNDSSLVCHKKMIFRDDLEYNFKITKHDLIDMSQFLNKNIQVKSTHYLNKNSYEGILQIIELEDNSPNQIDENVCYASRELLTQINDALYKNIDNSHDIDAMIYTIDDEKYLDDVIKEIDALDYIYSDTVILDTKALNFVKLMKYYALVLCLIFTLLFIVKLNKDDLDYRLKDYYILKNIGLSHQEYFKILFLENLNLIIKSFLFTNLIICLFYSIKTFIISNYPFILSKNVILIDYLAFLIYFLLIYIFINIISLKQLRKSNNNNQSFKE